MSGDDIERSLTELCKQAKRVVGLSDYYPEYQDEEAIPAGKLPAVKLELYQEQIALKLMYAAAPDAVTVADKLRLYRAALDAIEAEDEPNRPITFASLRKKIAAKINTMAQKSEPDPAEVQEW